jgi:uncharacterized protein DUF6602
LRLALDIPVNKGTPKETFISDFLRDHLGETFSIGQGEIISAVSEDGEARNQFEIVLYKKQFPKLVFGGGINAFLVESVAATIEVKSNLTKEELRSAVRAAHRLKSMPRRIGDMLILGDPRPAPLSLLVAYNGPAHMETVRNWLDEIHDEEDIDVPPLPTERAARNGTATPSIDGVSF